MNITQMIKILTILVIEKGTHDSFDLSYFDALHMFGFFYQDCMCMGSYLVNLSFQH